MLDPNISRKAPTEKETWGRGRAKGSVERYNDKALDLKVSRETPTKHRTVGENGFKTVKEDDTYERWS